MKRAFLILWMLLPLSACAADTAVPIESIENKVTPAISPFPAVQDAKETYTFLAENPQDLSAWDYETAYNLCAAALSDYYKAVWNGLDMDLSAYFENLQQYMHQKITSYYDTALKNNLPKNPVIAVDVGATKTEFVSENKGFFYLKLNARVKKGTGSFAEPTEFLVNNADGRLVIADWYTQGKDSYDSTMRGLNQKINNPDIWSNPEWVKSLGKRAE